MMANPCHIAFAILTASFASVAIAQSLLGLGDEKAVEARIPDPLPAVQTGDALLQFHVSPVSRNRFAIDLASLGIDEGKLVRYTLVITSETGARNVSYEALRCATGEHRLLAIGRPDGSWSVLRNSAWRTLDQDSTVSQHKTILFRSLCSGGGTASATTDGLRTRLRNPPAPQNH